MIKYPYSKPEITKSDILKVTNVLRSGYLTQGKEIKIFESKISKKFKSQYTVVCNSGTAALHLVYSALNLGPNNGLLTTPLTFLATANAAKMCNAPVIFCDVDPLTGLMTAETIENALIKSKIKIKVITVVHLGGNLCNMKKILEVAEKYNCLIVEDACHAPGAFYNKNLPVGSSKYSVASTFSFHAIKHVAMGEGGCITTNNLKLYKNILLKRNHGIERDRKNLKFMPEKNALWYYEMNDLGWNYRADEMTCALGCSQLTRLEKNINRRRSLVNYYYKYLKDEKWVELPIKNNFNVWHLFPIKINFKKLGKSRGEVMKELEGYGIGSQVHYIPLYMQPYYKEKNFKKYKGANEYYKNTLSIPLYVQLKKSDIFYISQNIKNILVN